MLKKQKLKICSWTVLITVKKIISKQKMQKLVLKILNLPLDLPLNKPMTPAPINIKAMESIFQ